MAANTSPIFVGTPKSPGVTLTTTTLTTLYTAGSNGGYCGSIWVYPTSTYTGSGAIQLWLNDGTDRLLGQYTITAGTAFNLLDATNCPAKINLQASAILKVQMTAISAGSVYATITDGGDY